MYVSIGLTSWVVALVIIISTVFEQPYFRIQSPIGAFISIVFFIIVAALMSASHFSAMQMDGGRRPARRSQVQRGVIPQHRIVS